ncbi:hypothetical protein [Cytobacillus massiliigabonensis]|uniref:hypothetical protein n=1 Tax=Cytobacillus massiliigabonensis TaxID=1871011 RepID=UPI0015E07B39|nr:hypothetical protein [Cytobacillus massiliigabonensis]
MDSSFFCPSFRGTTAEPSINEQGTNLELNQDREKKKEKIKKENEQSRVYLLDEKLFK